MGDLQDVLRQATLDKIQVDLLFTRDTGAEFAEQAEQGEALLEVSFDLAEGKLGLELDDDLRVSKIKKKGLVSAWNSENPEQGVNLDDQLIQVNGQTTDLYDVLRQATMDKAQVDLRFIRDTGAEP